MVKIVVLVGMIAIGLFIFDPQFTSTLSCTAGFDAGMRDLNDRRAEYLERQQDWLLTQPAPSPNDPNAF